ncbi:hypothetical protein LSH36_446g01013 [Paralvinella palmiformis]|uniref:Phospholipase A-2-activating protein n=1 Tax=Paralvinella palmiformis TaxID=53620 RepID=A0AAD9JAN1_9ANNE|nr:hypothetical protein LSH36_446g01013 [Paralvinella palmiformis]
MAARYKIRCSVIGHEKDVRAVTPSLFPDGGIISTSRDVTARLWIPTEHELGFTEAHVMSGHSNFVNCVCVMPPDEKYPQGLIMTGSTDNNILAFNLESPSPVYKLEGHTKTVCSLAAGKFGTLVSGSWDETAKVWLNEKCLMTLKGHGAAVWCVTILPEGGFMLTGSADKSIRLWRAGKCEKTFLGHEDCVRGLAVLSTIEFLSCANDASVKHWSTDGTCLHTYYAHTNYIYSIALLPNGKDFVTTGEDRTMRVWSGGECIQTVAHPTESVWSVCVLANGDIVTGASDGIIRVFSSDQSRQASEEEQKTYEELLASSAIPTQIGDIPASELHDPEALLIPGKRDGQNLMVKDDNNIQMYQWDASKSHWNKIGDVVGASGGSQASSGKQLYQGKASTLRSGTLNVVLLEYDYVFDVEIQEGGPTRKLPYNLTEDPWMAAHNFLANNDLDQMLLDQVAKFIIEQTKGVSLGMAMQPTVSDPLTGGGRYIPRMNETGNTELHASDPFTGPGRYMPSYSSPENGGEHGSDPYTGNTSYKPSASSSVKQINTNFPVTSYISFDQAKISGILSKLKEFNGKVNPAIQASEEVLTRLADLLNGDPPKTKDLDNLSALLKWPSGMLFPVLDIIRLLIRSENVNQYFCCQNKGVDFLNFLLSFISMDAPVHNQMLSLRTLCNIFKNEPGRNVEVKIQCLAAAVTVSESQNDGEASYRLLACIGTLIDGDKNSAEIAKSLGVLQFINRCIMIPEPAKISECAKQLEMILR